MTLKEAIRNLNDEKIDNFINTNWDGSAMTYKFNIQAIGDIAKIIPDVLISKDSKYFYIPGTLESKQAIEVDKILKKYKLIELDDPRYGK